MTNYIAAERINPVTGKPFEPREQVLARMDLADHHRAMLHSSAISDEVIAERGYVTAYSPMDDLHALDLAGGSCPALVIPEYALATGEMRLTVRSDRMSGTGRKYVGEKKPTRITASPRARDRLLHPTCLEIVIVEGAKKADALWSAGIATASIPGVWNWGATPGIGLEVYSDLEALRLNNKRVVIGFDSDVRTKWQVMQALLRFTRMLQERGSEVMWAIPPAGIDGGKQGIDDFLASVSEAGDV